MTDSYSQQDSKSDHISVCICTYKRPQMLSELLSKLQNQVTGNQFTYSAVIVDNDVSQSAREVVKVWQQKSTIQIDYYCEPEQNIALARNKAVERAKGNFIAFIDDDEFPIREWLLNLYNACKKFGADGVLGPVKPYFDEKAPEWLVRSKICERASYKTGTTLHWGQTRTGNALLKKDMLEDGNNIFNPELGRTGGEDMDFFRRMMDAGRSFVWCNEAAVFETVLPLRWQKSYYIKKYLQMGGMTGEKIRRECLGCRFLPNVTLSLGFYGMALPFAFLMGQHLFMRCLVKVAYSLAWIAGFSGRVIKRYRYE